MSEIPDVLRDILSHKREELDVSIRTTPPEEVRRLAADAPPPRDMVRALRRDGEAPVRLLGEIKRRSPSAGLIREHFDPARLAEQLARAGVDAVSVLTDEKFFGGRLEYLAEAREASGVPVLRKDFLVDPYQVREARAWGADAFLLIADVLETDALREMVELGAELGMAALVEGHDSEAVERAVGSGARLVGINNRNLRTFKVSLETTQRLARLVPPDRVLVAESGIHKGADVETVLSAGAHAVLVGESLMRAENLEKKVQELKAAR